MRSLSEGPLWLSSAAAPAPPLQPRLLLLLLPRLLRSAGAVSGSARAQLGWHRGRPRVESLSALAGALAAPPATVIVERSKGLRAKTNNTQ